jgi:hypothetical protein
MIDETVLYHLNHRMMTALIAPDVIESKPYPAIYNYIQELREEGYNIYMGDRSYQYSEEDLHVVDRLVAWITQMMFAENLVSHEESEMGKDANPRMFTSLIVDAQLGLLACEQEYTDGINFFIADGDDIILVPSPYFIFENVLHNKSGLTRSPYRFVDKDGTIF